ncbi:MAG: lectin-like domain-containing protein [Flavobacteriales bacterium]
MNRKILVVLLLLFGKVGCGQIYFLNGSATATGNDCYQLTAEINTQNGTVWYGEQIDLTQPFDLSFLMNYGSLDGNGADGICFVLQTVGTSAIGESGGGLGYLNFGTSLGIEFDTWQNAEYGDPWEDHIAIEMDGDINHNSANNIAGPVQADPFDVNIEDGEDHVVRITWNPITQELEVYFDCVFRLLGEIDLINEVFSGQELVYWGFTAATGGSYNYQTVCLQENIVTSANEVMICAGASAELGAGSSLDGVYNWQPADYLNDTDTAVVVATPPVTTTYTVTFTDLCGDLNQNEITVVVEELELTLVGIELITCLNAEVSLVADINFNLQAEYNWELDGVIVQQGTNEQNVDVTNAATGMLTVNFQDVCFDTINFEINEDLLPYSADAGPDAVINCYSSTVTLQGSSNGDDAQFEWMQNGIVVGTESGVAVGETGIYYLEVSNPLNGCLTYDKVYIDADYSAPGIFADVQDTLSCLNPIVQIQLTEIESQHNFSLLWTTQTGNILSGEQTDSPMVNSEGFYTLTATDTETGCVSTEEIYVEENEDMNFDPSLIQFPNVFSPDNDNLNAAWRPYLPADTEKKIDFFFAEYNLKIYNRWGAIIFETADAKNAWMGSDATEGTYYYHVLYKTLCSDGSIKQREGFIQLLR